MPRVRVSFTHSQLPRKDEPALFFFCRVLMLVDCLYPGQAKGMCQTRLSKISHCGLQCGISTHINCFPGRHWTRLWKIIRFLNLLKEVGSSSGITPLLVRWPRHVWWAYAFRKRTSSVYAWRKSWFPAWSGISSWPCQPWMPLPHSPKDHWNTKALSWWQSGDTVGRDLSLSLSTTSAASITSSLKETAPPAT